MAEYIVIPKNKIDDSILHGLILEDEDKSGYNPIYKHITAVIDKNINTARKEKEQLDAAISTSDYSELKRIFTNITTQKVEILKNIDRATENRSLEKQIEKIKEDFPNVTLGESDYQSMSFSVKEAALSYKNIETSDFWELKFENVRIKVIFSLGEAVKIIKIITNINHPFFDVDMCRRTTDSDKFFSVINYDCIYSSVKQVMDFMFTYGANKLKQPIVNFIGKKCAISGLYVFKNGVTCLKTAAVMHKDFAKLFNGSYYHPNVVKTCNSCGKENINWVSKDKVITCGECNDK